VEERRVELNVGVDDLARAEHRRHARLGSQLLRFLPLHRSFSAPLDPVGRAERESGADRDGDERL
jgi:hypothetical protein